MPETRVKVRDLPPTAVRLAPELRHALLREAAINGRTLHGEIVHRIKQSLDQPTLGNVPTGRAANESETQYLREHTDSERALLTLFRRLSPEKQLALLSLLKA